MPDRHEGIPFHKGTTVTITLHWWMVPIAMVLATLGLWWHGSRESGMFGGMTQALIGFGLLIGAVCATLVGLLK